MSISAHVISAQLINDDQEDTLAASTAPGVTGTSRNKEPQNQSLKEPQREVIFPHLTPAWL
jgi:hypothetical protein